MKVLAALAFAAFMMVGSASATTYYVVGTCGTFSNAAPNAALSGSWTCPSAASLGITGGLTVASEFVNYSADYSNGLANNVTTVTNYSFSGAGLAFSTDTLTSTGGSNSNGAVSTDGLTSNILTTTPNGWVSGGVVLAGFYDNASTFGTVTVNYTNQATVGSALQATGYAQIIYDYNVTSSTPEPVSMMLFGSGLLALSIVGRRKFARK
jgi:hypothetical protein